jgi:zinc transport system permease protein
MLEPFVIKALLAGIGISFLVAVLGCFVIWRKMAYFGDSLAHSSLLGIALGLLYNINVNIGIIIICLLFATLLSLLSHKKILAIDSLLGIFAHGSLAIGMILLSIAKAPEVDLHAYLFGDILKVDNYDLMIIYGAVFACYLVLYFSWSCLNLITICQDLARSQGINIFFHQILLMLLMTIAVAISVHIVGILLITAMMIIPAASARRFAKSPESMAIIAVIFAILSSVIGIFGAIFYELPSGPMIVASSVSLFVLGFLFSSRA